ncbi:ABC transporter ATP-binding protein [Pigmentiphaga sp. NML080357]|uniref:ABC transporter ATP-binding protein n=1 Tax=Pigmentiphaga sp. NML080357 TaxID=2008675 RepID=UPI000B418E20|nr:ABC transporter ATP-binding protein [Pigmentiphaga sp. NML080357]OVZ60314.1 ABC transporter ATP-binding protein [Pigmentiphaga sp. NML080357]
MTDILYASGLVKRYGALVVTDGLDLTLRSGELHAVIGPNGAGKTTLIHQLAGEIAPDAGAIVLKGRDITRAPVHRRALAGLGRSYQITSVFREFSVLENVMLAVQARQGHSFRFWRPAGRDAGLAKPAREALERVRLGHAAQRRTGTLAHGEMRQLEIAMALAMRPEVLLLDEPMAGMSRQESAGLVELLAELKGLYSIVLVEHDMDAVFALADRITVLSYGRAIACGTPAAIRCDEAVRTAYLGEGND